MFYELGAGKVLSGLVKRITPKAGGAAIGTPAEVEAFKARARRRIVAVEASGEDLMFDLSGMRALVTGASGGLGGGDRRHLACAGRGRGRFRHTPRRAGPPAQELADRTYVLPCDLADRAAVEALVPAAEAAMGGLDILVNNAGITRDNLFIRMRDEEWDDVLAVNLTAAFRLSRAVLRGMMKRRFGRIIAITSVVGVKGNPGQGNYAASKAGMIGMVKSLAGEVASRNITVNCIAPGFIASPMTAALNDKQKETILGDDSGRPSRRAAGRRGGRRLSGEPRGRLRHRPDVACQRRHGDDMKPMTRM